MTIQYPSYYKTFSCIASACPDSCCHEWVVQVDDDSAQRFLALEGALGDALRKVLYWKNGECYLGHYKDRCAMWRDDGLCHIQAELGHEALCDVCRTFPRLTHDYGDFVEYGLELSCPEAARLILNSPLEWVTETVPGGEEPEYDGELMDILRRSRPYALSLLEDDTYTVPERLRLLLMYAYHIQGELDGVEPTDFDPAASLEFARRFAGPGDAVALLDDYAELEVLTNRWFEKTRDSRNLTDPVWDEGLCRIAQYAVCRYWYQAVSDYDLTGRVKMILSGFILISRLPGDLLENAQLWSKEIENSSENLEELLYAAYTQQGLTDANLLGLLK